MKRPLDKELQRTEDCRNRENQSHLEMGPLNWFFDTKWFVQIKYIYLKLGIA